MTTAVAIALYNGSRFLGKQLDSIRLQTLKPEQVILCDDVSEDDTVELVENYISVHALEKTWKLYKNERNLGYIRNFYRAISLCEADLIFLSDQDDIWKPDKIAKMTQIMEQKKEALLISHRYGIIDAQDVEQHSFVERKVVEDETLRSISIKEIMKAYRWPGMTMCLRKDFFTRLHPVVENVSVAHDLMLAVNAADQNGFFEYNYAGAYHRRHDNNAAREEHRITKLLNLQRKLTDIEKTKQLWSGLASSNLPISEISAASIQERLALMDIRLDALKSRSFRRMMSLYFADRGHYLRVNSLICDLWLICFGAYKAITEKRKVEKEW